MELVKYDLGEMHNVQLRMLNSLIKVCNDNNLLYCLAFGSLLGAVRNHKIIAWDDSIDVVMPYADYLKLLNLPANIWGDYLFLQTYNTDLQYPKCYAKLRNSDTTLIKSDYSDLDMNHGIYINVMPLISMVDDGAMRKHQIRNAELYKALVENKPTSLDKGITHLHSLILLKLPEKIRYAEREKYKGKILAFEDKGTKDCFVLAGDFSLKHALPKVWFEKPLDWEFEGISVKIPNGWHEWLTLRYGDYKETPIADLQNDKTARFITLNTEKPYTDYKGKSYCVDK